MRRRAVITGVGASVASLAGCLGLGGDTQTVRPGSSSTETRTNGTPETEPAALALSAVRAPETVEIGASFEITFVVENSGGEPGVFRAPVGVQAIDSVEYQELTTAEVYVRPGETQEGVISVPGFEYVRDASFRVNEGERTWTVQVTPRTLALGETYALPRDWSGFDLSVTEFELTSEYEDIDGETAGNPPEGKQFAFARIQATNDNEQGRQFIPAGENFTLETQRGTFSFENLIYRAPRRYIQQKIRAGETFEGWLGFTVPEDISRGDVRVSFFQSFSGERDVSLFWDPSS